MAEPRKPEAATLTAEELAAITTRAQWLDALERGVPIVPLLSTPYMQKLTAKRRAVLDLVRPHYKASLVHIEFYRGWSDDNWDRYIGSRWVEAEEIADRLRDGLPPWPDRGA